VTGDARPPGPTHTDDVGPIDLSTLSPSARAGRLLQLRTTIDALEVEFCRTLAAVDVGSVSVRSRAGPVRRE
jgi:hypothetical protein